MRWQWETLSNLTPLEQYALHRARQQVFAVEQGIAYLDADGVDLDARHLIGWEEGEIAAYLRVLPFEGRVQIGRVLTGKDYRGRGLGRELMERGATHIAAEWGAVVIEMKAQVYLERFYTSLGYRVVGSPCVYNGVPHLEMAREL